MCSCRGPRTCKQGRRIYNTLLLQAMALYIHGPLRCKNLLGRIPNPHSRPLWQRRSTHPARALMHAANAPRRGRSATDQAAREPPARPQPRTQQERARTGSRPQTPPGVAATTHTIRPPHTSRQTGPRCPRPCYGPRWTPPGTCSGHPQTARKSRSLNRPAHTAGHQKQGTA